jgi:outer membrane receptor for ferric coprogen and ferric-rhodotorulic acid
LNLIDLMNTTRNPLLRPSRLATALAVLTLLSAPLARAQAVAPAQPATEPEKAPPKDKDVVELSPFTVKSEKDTGYFAENTLAGSRLNTNIADLAASITVVTKQQMEDTASVDINRRVQV